MKIQMAWLFFFLLFSTPTLAALPQIRPLLVTPGPFPILQTFLQHAEASLPPAMILSLRHSLSRPLLVTFYTRKGTGALGIPLTYSKTNGDIVLDGDLSPPQLLATLFHRMTHLYDSSYQGGRQRLSSNARFQALTGWHHQSKSPDPQTLEKPRESLAVNMEYYLQDPEYACRRPAVFSFLREKLEGYDPFPNRQCQINRSALLSNLSGKIVLLDPDRIYQIHFLLATSGQAAESRWGHAMLRLIVCAPHRPLGPDCLHDTEHHLVLSYQANVTDPEIHYLKGLSGDYSSRLYLNPLEEVVERYTQGEMRNMISLPLSLNRENIRTLLDHVLEQKWNYNGRYFFLTNNCSTEILKTLRATLGAKPLFNIQPLSPIGLYEELSRLRYIDPTLIQDLRQAVGAGFFFFSGTERVDQIFKTLKRSLPKTPWIDFYEYLNLSNADERRTLFLDFLHGSPPPQEQVKVARLFLAMESRIIRTKKSRLQATILAKLRTLAEKKPLSEAESRDLPEFTPELVELIKLVEAQNLINEKISGGLKPISDPQSYGIPVLASDLPRQPDLDPSLQKKYFELLQRFENWKTTAPGDEFDEIRASVSNEKLFFSAAHLSNIIPLSHF